MYYPEFRLVAGKCQKQTRKKSIICSIFFRLLLTLRAGWSSILIRSTNIRSKFFTLQKETEYGTEKEFFHR